VDTEARIFKRYFRQLPVKFSYRIFTNTRLITLNIDFDISDFFTPLNYTKNKGKSVPAKAIKAYGEVQL
jgi:hypothetical protein